MKPGNFVKILTIDIVSLFLFGFCYWKSSQKLRKIIKVNLVSHAKFIKLNYKCHTEPWVLLYNSVYNHLILVTY